MFVSAFVVMKNEHSLCPKELQDSDEKFRSNSETLGYAFYLLIVELTLIVIRIVLVAMFGTSWKETKEMTSAIVYKQKSVTALSDTNLMF